MILSLIGMPGSGKTTLGRLVARELGWDFVDMDDAIQDMAGRTIPELFSQGEPVFRQWEAYGSGLRRGGSPNPWQH